jgi:hypothetical protein
LDHLAILYHTGHVGTVEFLQFRQELTDRVLLALFETASSAAEVVCERDRADQIADRMDEIDGVRVKTLTLPSIVVGGLASIISGGGGLAAGPSTAADAADVAGGVFASIFGGTALFTGSQHKFGHERNVLSEIWNDPPDSSIFSPMIWRYLHHRQKERATTRRDELLDAWRQEGRLGKPNSSDEQKRVALLFGKGGVYTATELRARASMLETLEATIRLINEELELFIREMSTKFIRRS